MCWAFRMGNLVLASHMWCTKEYLGQTSQVQTETDQ